jgi:hypothetical protein
MHSFPSIHYVSLETSQPQKNTYMAHSSLQVKYRSTPQINPQRIQNQPRKLLISLEQRLEPSIIPATVLSIQPHKKTYSAISLNNGKSSSPESSPEGGGGGIIGVNGECPVNPSKL